MLIPYITAGFPTKKLFVPILKTLSDSGADYIEVGVPHSDPLADGPTIQYASSVALKNGVTLKWIVEACHGMPLRGIKPLILFSYLNPILQYGFEKLLKDLPKSLFSGLIIPDLPLEEAKKYLVLLKKYNLNLILLIAPTTKKEKIKEITKASRGLIYLVSVSGTTGIRNKLPVELKNKIKEIKSYTKTPVVVGFGISNSKHLKQIISYGADGIVIGSALINKMKERNNNNVLLAIKKFIQSFSSEKPAHI